MGLGLIRHLNQKENKKRKEYQLIISKIFEERGFSAADIIWTNSTYKGKEMVYNIVLCVKDGTVSFFGGGSMKVKFGTNDEKVWFGPVGVSGFSQKKLLKEEEDILFCRTIVGNFLFPKNNWLQHDLERKKFKHLFDISVSDIEKVEGKQRIKEIEFIIECSDDLIILSPQCANVDAKIPTVNTLIGAFEKIINGTLSNKKISNINCDMIMIDKEDSKITNKRQLKIAGAVLGSAVVIGGIAAASGTKNWSKDR